MEQRSSGRLVGRDAQLRMVDGLLDELDAGRVEVLLLVSEAGIGKTRLAEELMRRAARRGARTAWASAWDGEGVPPLWPWAELLRQLTGTAAELEQALPESPTAVPATRFAQFATATRSTSSTSQGNGDDHRDHHPDGPRRREPAYRPRWSPGEEDGPPAARTTSATRCAVEPRAHARRVPVGAGRREPHAPRLPGRTERRPVHAGGLVPPGTPGSPRAPHDPSARGPPRLAMRYCTPSCNRRRGASCPTPTTT